MQNLRAPGVRGERPGRRGRFLSVSRPGENKLETVGADAREHPLTRCVPRIGRPRHAPLRQELPPNLAKRAVHRDPPIAQRDLEPGATDERSDVGGRGPRGEDFWRAELSDRTSLDDRDPVGQRSSIRRVVRDDEGCPLETREHAAQLGTNFRTRFHVEGREGLVKQQDTRRGRERPSERNLLRLPSRELGRATGREVVDAEALGGTKLLAALSAPYKHTGVRFMPTGGAAMANLESYLRIDTVAAVGGTWIAKTEDMAQGKWDEIAQRCREACALVAAARGL